MAGRICTIGGSCALPGSGPRAVLLVTPFERTPLWLIASNAPEELRAAIDRARAALPKPVPEPVPEGSQWLPPLREKG